MISEKLPMADTGFPFPLYPSVNSMEEVFSRLPPMASLNLITDGACSGNPGCGGWACIFQEMMPNSMGYIGAISGHASYTTNNRMEMQGVLFGLRVLKKFRKPPAISIYSDSQYLIKGVTQWVQRWMENGWKTSQKKPVENQDLWKELVHVKEGLQIEWRWVKGHAGHIENELADALAQKALNLKLGISCS